jgi:hypothetical protein
MTDALLSIQRNVRIFATFLRFDVGEDRKTRLIDQSEKIRGTKMLKGALRQRAFYSPATHIVSLRTERNVGL